MIVERFNAVMTGLSNYYLGVMRNSCKMHRCIYILRFSCLKTLAQKRKSSIGKIFKKYGEDMFSKACQTIAIKATVKYRGVAYEKSWKLLTYKEIKDKCNEKNKADFLHRVKLFMKLKDKDFTYQYPLKKNAEGHKPALLGLHMLGKP